MKVLFFDTWTKGVRNFSRLVDALEKVNFQYKLVHLESWGEPCEEYKMIGKIDCYDIAYYKTNYIYDILKKEKPDVVLVLSLSYLLDRTVVSMCNYLGIKVVYLAHGKIYMKQGVGNLKDKTSIFDRIFGKLKSKSSMILRNYIRFNMLTRFKPILIINTILEFLNHSNKSMFTPYTEEFKVDAGMVYYESEKKMYENERQFPKGMIRAVGNPEMDYIINQNIIARTVFLNSISFPDKPYALYLDDGFTQEGILNYNEWKGFILDIYKPLQAKGMGLVIKLHPRTDVEPMNDFFKKYKILALKDVDFKNVIYHSEFVLSHSSSTVIYGMILNKPVLLPRWGKMQNLIRNYPENVVEYCESIEKYEKLLNHSIPLKNVHDYLEENCGALDGKAVDRIVHTIFSIANQQ